LGLVIGINRAEGDTIHTLCQQVINLPFLVGGGSLRGDPKLHRGIVQFRVGLLGSFARNGPEIGSIVGNESEPKIF
jgi:hypothetical protein